MSQFVKLFCIVVNWCCQILSLSVVLLLHIEYILIFSSFLKIYVSVCLHHCLTVYSCCFKLSYSCACLNWTELLLAGWIKCYWFIELNWIFHGKICIGTIRIHTDLFNSKFVNKICFFQDVCGIWNSLFRRQRASLFLDWTRNFAKWTC